MRKLRCLLIIATASLCLTPFSFAASHISLQLAIKAIERHYVEPSQLNAKKLFEAATKSIEKTVPETLIEVSKTGVGVTVGLAKKRFPAPPKSMGELSKCLIPIIDFVETHREHFPDETSASEAALSGITSELDPHTDFLPPKIFKEFRVGTKGEFGGLGIVIGIRDGQLTVIAPIGGTPAWRANLKSGDKIVQINDESTINMSITDAVNRLRGKIGTKVSIVVESQGKKPRTVTLTRALITIDSIQHAIYEYGGKKFAYIRVKSFQENTMDDFNAAYDKMKKDGPLSGMILDLRDDPGGLLDQAVKLSDKFLSKGDIVSTVLAHNISSDRESARDQKSDIALPLIVLVNEGSASGSEIVAGALKYNDRALAVGQRTFGKGTVQTIFELGDGSALKLTIAQYFSAGKHPIQQEGIIPDILLEAVTIDKESMDIVPNETRSEKSLEHTLKGLAKTNDKAMLVVPYFQPKVEDDDASYYSNEPKLDDEFAVKFSARILSKSEGADAKSMKKAALEVYKDVAHEEDGKIMAALKKEGIDWKRADVTIGAAPPISLNYKLLNMNGKPLGAVKAGTEFTFELDLKNNSSKAVPRTIAVLREPKEIGGAEHEFVFGMLPKGASAVRKNKITFPAMIPGQLINLEMTIKSNGNDIIKDKPIPIMMDGANKPEFAIRYKLSGKPSNKSTSSLNVNITNIGNGTASDKAVAVLYDECDNDIFIKKGRFEIAKLKAGETFNAKFLFRLRSDNLPPHCYIRLGITDMEFYSLFSQRIALTQAGLIPQEGKRYEAPKITVESLPLSTSSGSIDLNATISSDYPIKDWSIYTNEEKTAYEMNPQKTKSIQIKRRLILSKDRNSITILARDVNNLAASKSLVILKKDEK